MNTSIPKNSQLPSSPPGCGRRLLRSFSSASLAVLVLVGLASSAQAWFITGVTRDCNCTNLNIQLADFPDQDLLVQLGGVTIPGTYNFASQQIVATLPPGQGPGAYVLAVWSVNNELLAVTNFSLSCCSSGTAGPAGVKGDTGATGPQGPRGAEGGRGGTRGEKGPRGDAGPVGARGPTGATGRAGPAGPAGPTGGATGATGPAGPTGPTGATGPVGPAGQGGGSPQYGYVYNVSAETVAIEADVIFDS
ncbi:MAG: hypothetical protein QOJ40_3009, partial [Verrucomicrobiota bacterium]